MKHPMQKLRYDNRGVIRFVSNDIVKFLLDTSKNDLNDLSRMNFDREDWEQFAQLIGYSLTGFDELSYVSDEAYSEAQRQAEQLKNAGVD